MLATVIVNRYVSADVVALADAIDELCSPNDTYGWSSSGVYCFWNFDTKEILYLGLAIDLALRFRQHNGLSACPENCCKRAQIAAHFQIHAHLGFSVFVQSSIVQSITHRWEGRHPGELEWIAENFGYFDADQVKGDLNPQVVDALRKTEGAMLAAHKKDHGRFPVWNERGGLKRKYAESKFETARHFMRSFTRSHPRDDPFTARSTFQELAAKSLRERYERFLHAARMHMLIFGVSLHQACDEVHDGFGDLPKIRAESYITKQPEW